MTAIRPARTVDPRSPYVLDTRELGRRPGSMQPVRRSVPARGGWELGIVAVPEHADVILDLRLEAVMDGVLVSGTAQAPVNAECGRCLEPLAASVRAEVQELFAYEPTPGDDDQALVVGDFIDLEPLVHDAVVLALPLNPVCTEDCSGLCPRCGERLADAASDHSHDMVDSRWAALGALSAEPAHHRETAHHLETES
jgi:uncharacterized protein